MRIMLVEDDLLLGEGLQEALEVQGYVVDWFKDGESAVAAMRRGGYELVVLDLGLPGRDGLSLLAEWRGHDLALPVLILTARDTLTDRVGGLDAGADDYLLKPFDLAELLARIRALLRRAAGRPGSSLVHGRVTLDPVSHDVTLDGGPVTLSRREFLLLKEFLMHPGKVLSKSQLEESLYGWSDEVESNTLEVHIHHLRKKLYPELIRTVRGAGYILDAPATTS